MEDVMLNIDSIYKPLDASKRQVRFMRMHHDHEAPVFDCEIAVFSLDDEPQFKALSYCWTTAKATCEIRLNGKPFYVRQNLYDYLAIMKEEEHTEWVFIDAVCINQENTAEQASQVSLMGDVYRGAIEVVAWLGITEMSETFKDDLKGLQDFCDKFEEKVSLQTYHPDTWKDTTSCILKDLFPDDVVSAEDNRQLLVMIHTDCEYWFRLWIVQELILARKLIIRCATLCLRAEALTCLLHGYGRVGRWSDDTVVAALRILRSNKASGVTKLVLPRILLSCRWRMQEKGDRCRTSLVEAVSLFSLQSCSRPYDSIFGLIGVTRAHIPISYDLPPLELYLRATIQCLLELVSRGIDQKDTSDVPFDNMNVRTYNFVGMPFLHALLDALSLPRYDLTVYAVTQEALELCQHPTWYSVFNKMTQEVAGRYWRFRASTIIHWYRGQIMKRNFRKARNKNAPMPNPFNREDVRLYSEWCAFVMDVYLDVLARMWESDDQFRSWAMEQDHLVASMKLKGQLQGDIESYWTTLRQLRN